MEKTSLSPYRYLTFLLPGALLLFVILYGWSGWSYGEPGAGALLGLSIASFVTGHVLAAVANFFQPIWWGHAPGSRLKSMEGLFDKAGRYADSRAEVLAAFNKQHPQVSNFEAQFGAAYQAAQKGPLAAKLLSMVEEIGYYRSMATASAVSCLLLVIFNCLDHHHLPLWPWLTVFVLSTGAHAYRFRRFWRYVGEYVTGEVLQGN